MVNATSHERIFSYIYLVKFKKQTTMAKNLKHSTRIHTLNEEGKKSFALIGFTEEMDSCVTLLKCDVNKIGKELRRYGNFSRLEIDVISQLKCGEEYRPDNYSLIVNLS